MFEGAVAEAGDAGDDLAVAAVASLRTTSAVRAAADATELQAIATLATVRRTQALTDARRRGRERDRARGQVPGSGPVPRVDLDEIDRYTAQEVSLALWLSPVVARDRLELALELVHRRPLTFDALRAGEIDLPRARRIAAAVRDLPPDPSADPGPRDEGDGTDGATGTDGTDDGAAVGGSTAVSSAAAAVEAEILRPGSVPALSSLRPGRPAGQLTMRQLGSRLDRLVLRADPGGAGERTDLADARRGCTLRPLPDGMAMLSVTGRAELVTAAFQRIDAAAHQLVAADAGERRQQEADGLLVAPGTRGPRPGHDAARTLDQARVDALLTHLLGHGSDLTQAVGTTITVALVAPADTVLAGGDDPGELLGYGPLPAPLTRALAADADWTRWLHHPTSGEVTDVSSHTYRPSRAVARQVRARDRHCRFPTCSRPAQRCDLDHVVAHPDGSSTRCNLASECRLHHLLKHRAGFRLRLAPDGTTTWTTPTGDVVVDHPPGWGRPPPAAVPSSTPGASRHHQDPHGGAAADDEDEPPF